MTLFDKTTPTVTGADVATWLRGWRFPIGAELEFQNAVERVLTERGARFEREKDIRGRGTIDFYLPDGAVGIELKVKGSPADVMRQLHRYAGSDEIAELVLVTGRARVGQQMPSAVCGKPLSVVTVWEGLL